MMKYSNKYVKYHQAIAKVIMPKLKIITYSAFIIVWIFTILPIASILVEFSGNTQCVGLPHCKGSEGFVYAKLYSPFFIYPIFGLFTTIFLMNPFYESMKFISKYSIKLCVFVVAIIISFSFYATSEEIRASTPAIWNLKSSVTQEDKEIRKHLNTVCIKNLIFLNKYPLSRVENQNTTAVSERTASQKKKFQDTLSALYKNRENRSWTNLFYALGFFSQTLLFVFVIPPLFLTIAGKMTKIDSMIKLEYALFVMGVWLLMRIIFVQVKGNLYNPESDSLYSANFLIAGILIISILHINIAIIPAVGRFFERFISFAGIFLALLGPILAIVSHENLQSIFGVGSDWQTYFTIWIFVLYIFVPYLFNPYKEVASGNKVGRT